MSKKAFTLLELLIVIALIVVLGTMLLVLLNPWQQIGKANDAKRKHDLDVLKKTMEDYYNDKGCYPLVAQLCYDVTSPPPPGPTEIRTGVGSSSTLDSYTCHICDTKDPNRPNFSPYLSPLPCDPEHPTKQYLYQVDATNGNCPKWYITYDRLNVQNDQDSINLGCVGNGCGPKAPYGYNYGVSSPNKTLGVTSRYSCIQKPNLGSTCNVCGTYQQCLNDTSCTDKIYGNDSCQ